MKNFAFSFFLCVCLCICMHTHAHVWTILKYRLDGRAQPSITLDQKPDEKWGRGLSFPLRSTAKTVFLYCSFLSSTVISLLFFPQEVLKLVHCTSKLLVRQTFSSTADLCFFLEPRRTQPHPKSLSEMLSRKSGVGRFQDQAPRLPCSKKSRLGS